MPKRTKRQREIEKKMEKQAEAMISGEGLFDFSNYGVMKTGKKMLDVGKKLIYGRTSEFAPSIQQLLNQYGNQMIQHITINRTPLSGMMTKALSVVSKTFGERSEGMTMYHLSMFLKLSNGKMLLCEKNEVPNIKLVSRVVSTGENMELDCNVSVNDFLNNGIQSYGTRNYFVYSARDSNCQDWVIANIQGSGLLTPAIKEFVKQEQTKGFFTDDLRKKANIITDIGNRANVLMEGGMI
jgi:hypothetical protein